MSFNIIATEKKNIDMEKAKVVIEEIHTDHEKLAHILGLTYNELKETKWNIEPDYFEDEDRVTHYGHIVYFQSNSPQNILKKVIGISESKQVWISHDSLYGDDYYDFEEYEAIVSNKFFYDSFKNEISNVRQLNEIQLENQILLPVLKRQLYITAIGVLETFLSETFINLTDENQVYFRNFVETFPDFKERKIPLNEIFKEYTNLKETAKKKMLEVIYHNLGKVKNMFQYTFKIEFPDIAILSKAINIRHDLVHRNGKTKQGILVVVNEAIVTELLNQISEFVETISKSLNLKQVE